jgi:hypothetical protein
VAYVVVGGWAAQRHGALIHTQDLDVCVQWSPENLERLAAALRELDAELSISATETLRPPVLDARLLAGIQIGNWSTLAGRLDTLRDIPKDAAGPGADYEQLVDAAVSDTVDGRPVRVARLQDIIRSKQAAGRPKDRAALPELERLASESRTTPEDPRAPPGLPDRDKS